MPGPVVLSIDLFKLLERSTLASKKYPYPESSYSTSSSLNRHVTDRYTGMCRYDPAGVHRHIYIKKYITRVYILRRIGELAYYTYIHTCTTVLLLASITFRS